MWFMSTTKGSLVAGRSFLQKQGFWSKNKTCWCQETQDEDEDDDDDDDDDDEPQLNGPDLQKQQLWGESTAG